jgi:uncharacterized radical SAM superfamily Fe-S cluster-containing enzyme
VAGTRPYLYYDAAVSVCNTCLRRVEGKIVFQDGKVYLDKWCPVHKAQRALISDDVAFYRKGRETYIKPPEHPRHFNTPQHYGCPYDCGLCPEHMQHSCLSLIEVTDLCNLRCPVCYADSGPHRPNHRSMDVIRRMLDAVVSNEGEPDVVQISGGEPTLHPEFFSILDEAKARPIKHLMLNTNGVRIAKEAGFAERLAAYQPGFEVYLQFDSLRASVHETLRGLDLRTVRQQALARLEAANVSTTLVVTLMKGHNDDEIGDIIRYALQFRCVRGVTFQPIQNAGRTEGYDPALHRLTISEVRRRIVEQSGIFTESDVLPVPCNADCLAMAYAFKPDPAVAHAIPLTGLVDPSVFIEGTRNTIVYERDPVMKDKFIQLFATNHSPESQANCLSDLLCCLPKIASADGAAPEMPLLKYENLFRVIIMQFIDAESFDLRAVRKSCVHIATPEGKLIPFDTYNLFYRDDRVKVLEKIRREIDAGIAAMRDDP